MKYDYEEDIDLLDYSPVSTKTNFLTATIKPYKQAAQTLTLQVKQSFVIKILASITLSLVILSSAGTLIKYLLGYDSAYGFVPNFNLDTEGNIPTYFAALTLLMSGLLFLVVAKHKRAINNAFANHWGILSFIFIYLSIDEASEIHGLVMRPLSAYEFSGIFYFSWVIPGMIAVAAFALYFLKFFFSLSQKFQTLFFTSAFVYLGGALGIELIGGAYADANGTENLVYSLITTLEETLEMVGILLLINSLLSYIREHVSSFGVSFKS